MDQALGRRLRVSVLTALAVASLQQPARAAWPATPPPLAPPSGRTVVVATEPELRQAVATLVSGTTILIKPGTYRLTRTLTVNGPLSDVAIRGEVNDRDAVQLVGAGRDNEAIAHGIWVGGDVRRLTIANLAISEVYYHAICLNPGPRAPLIHNVHLSNAGQQLLKTNPNADGTGIDNGVVEYSLFEYTPTSRDWYANAVQVLAGRDWVIRHNLVRNIRAPAGQLAGPAVLAWFSASGTIVESNTFVNCQREISLGLIVRSPHDHSGGIVRNNFIIRDQTVTDGDVAIGVFDSPGAKVLNNTVLLAGGYPNAVEYRFAGTTGARIENNLLNRAIAARDGAAASVGNNLTTTAPDQFLLSEAGDLHLQRTAVAAIGRSTPLTDVTDDWDGDPRPPGAPADLGADQYRPRAPQNLRIVRRP